MVNCGRRLPTLNRSADTGSWKFARKGILQDNDIRLALHHPGRRGEVTDNGYVDYISRQGAILALILLYSI